MIVLFHIAKSIDDSCLENCNKYISSGLSAVSIIGKKQQVIAGKTIAIVTKELQCPLPNVNITQVVVVVTVGDVPVDTVTKLSPDVATALISAVGHL